MPNLGWIAGGAVALGAGLGVARLRAGASSSVEWKAQRVIGL
jgi:hypothetical protein